MTRGSTLQSNTADFAAVSSTPPLSLDSGHASVLYCSIMVQQHPPHKHLYWPEGLKLISGAYCKEETKINQQPENHKLLFCPNSSHIYTLLTDSIFCNGEARD